MTTKSEAAASLFVVARSGRLFGITVSSQAMGYASHMTDLKQLLNTGDHVALTPFLDDPKAIAKAAGTSKKRVQTATRAFVLHQSAAGDAVVYRWLGTKAVTGVLLGLRDVAKDHPEVDRFCVAVGEQLIEGFSNSDWGFAVETLLQMRPKEALGYCLEHAERTEHKSPGLVGYLARGGDLTKDEERVRAYLARWEGTNHFEGTTRLWLIAKLGDGDAHNELKRLVLEGPMETDSAIRAAQALSNIHDWDLPFGEEGTKMAQERLRQEDVSLPANRVGAPG